MRKKYMKIKDKKVIWSFYFKNMSTVSFFNGVNGSRYHSSIGVRM